MSEYKTLLEHSYAVLQDLTECGSKNRLAYLAEHIFDFTTYDDDMAELFGMKAVEVANAITEGSTFDYIDNREGYKWYLLMCNFPFFAGRLNWGTSIRGAWWDHKAYELETCGLFVDGEQVTKPMLFTRDEWVAFMRALVAFVKGSEAP